MKKQLKGLLSILICIMLLLSATPVFAANINSFFNAKGFKDVPKGYWAYDDIMWMFERNIISGVGNGQFNPNGIVTRAEFAKMMVNTLNLKQYSPATPSFLDVGKKAWEYPYVEGAKTYLTGFRTASGDYFRPTQTAVREDMAVALVKALGYQNDAVDQSIINKFDDIGQISLNLRKYVALAVKHGLIQGYTENGKTLFKPQGNLTRAESATLLCRAFKNNEEKITYDDEKVTYDENTYVRPAVMVAKENNKVVVRWNRIDSENFREYRVVVSKMNASPKYPDNGYLYRITDRDKTYAVIDNSAGYNGGDFGSYLTKGEKYYFSVTAVYNDRNVAGNAVRFEYDGNDNPEAYVAPVVKAAEENGRLVLRWNAISSKNLAGYKVVASKNDSTPSYPENGYLYYITDLSRNYAVIDNTTTYTDGDFGSYFNKGEKYYFSITAVYKDRNIAGNVIRVQYNANDNPEAYVAPVVKAAEENGRLVLRWNAISSKNLAGYKVVASKNDSTPSYPENGYLYYITDLGRNYAVIDNTTTYTDGDFGSYFNKGEKYYFSITAVYKDRNIAGNAVRFEYDGNDNPEAYVAPVVSAAYEGGRLIVKWDKINSPLLTEYRVVISKNNKTPAYPADGFYDTAYGADVVSAEIDSSKQYTKGDFTALEYGSEYYISVTAVYNDKYVAGNAVKVLYLISEDAE